MKKNLLIALCISLIFSLRWITVLPFSGNTPILDNIDSIAFYGRFLIYAKEAFSYPIGLIKQLSFPFQTANIARGSIPLFALFFKLLSKAYAQFGVFHYFAFIEILAVFLTAYFSCLIFDYFKVNSLWFKFLGAVLVSLCPALLYRSSYLYSVSFIVWHFPLYLVLAYLYLKLKRRINKNTLISFVLLFLSSVLIDNYIFFSLSLLTALFIFFELLNSLFKRNISCEFKKLLVILIISIFISIIAYSSLGVSKNFQIPNHITPFNNRFSSDWGYGGGYGGGFHVADVFSLFISADGENKKDLSLSVGSASYLSQLGFPLTMKDLKPGQYEGFSYIGTVSLGLLLLLIIKKIVEILKNGKLFLYKMFFKIKGFLYKKDDLFSTAFILGLSSLILYILSWGYIVHLAGKRLNWLMTPSLLIAILWPEFMLIRSLGRLAIPLTIFIIIFSTVCLYKYWKIWVNKNKKFKGLYLNLIIFILIIVHLNEISSYLKPPEPVKGNVITNSISDKGILKVKRLLKNKTALLITPSFREDVNWDKLLYALAYYGSVPVSGATVGTGIPFKNKKVYNQIEKMILDGNIKALVAKYGKIAIAVPPDIGKKIINKSDLELEYNLIDKKLVILTIKGNKGEEKRL